MIDKAHLWTASPLNRRRFFTVSSGILAAGALAACGSNNGRTSDSSAAAPASGGGVASGDGVASGAPTSVAGSSSQASSSRFFRGSFFFRRGGSRRKAHAVAVVPPVRRGGHPAGGPRYAAAYPTAKVNVQWLPGDYDSKVAASLLTNAGPDVFEAGNGPTHRPDPGRPGRRRSTASSATPRRLHPVAHPADDLRGQALRRPAGHRHAVARLPQEPAGRKAGVTAAHRPSTSWSTPRRS